MIDLLVACACVALCMLNGHRTCLAWAETWISKSDAAEQRRSGWGAREMELAHYRMWRAKLIFRAHMVVTGPTLALWPLWTLWRELARA